MNLTDHYLGVVCEEGYLSFADASIVKTGQTKHLDCGDLVDHTFKPTKVKDVTDKTIQAALQAFVTDMELRKVLQR